MRKVSMDSRESIGRTRGEVRGENAARAGSRMEELENVRLKALFLSADGTDGQASGSGGEVIVNRVQVGSVARLSLDPSEIGPSLSGPTVGLLGSKRAGGRSSQGPSVGLKLKGVVADGVGLVAGPSSSKAKWWAAVEVSPSLVGVTSLVRDSPSPSQTQLLDNSLSVNAYSLACPVSCNLEAEFFKLREMEDLRKQQIEIHQSAIDRALVEEASRYGSVLNSWGLRVSRSSFLLSLSFGWTPKGEFSDHSRILREEI